ncbi:hypothetical protein PHMEG_00016674 [Phytophthora megakarya]|uniref:Uncharacterized protein n=1 Tax=Phytophthora megakarya TaxID=4795 RepID=A0A225VYP9_9STRA|nr:hypothetical protein PHMEG_00016674 [Phytophthora megakarya]
MELLPEPNNAQFFFPEILAMLDMDDIKWPVAFMKEEPLVELKPIKLLPLSEPRLKKRKKPATPRLRNKAKIELLRQEVKTLEAEVEALQRSKQEAETQKCRADPVWKTIALRQQQERDRAVQCNERLKRILHEQQRLTMSEDDCFETATGTRSGSALQRETQENSA